jgi:hypothetical protein
MIAPRRGLRRLLVCIPATVRRVVLLRLVVPIIACFLGLKRLIVAVIFLLVKLGGLF